MIALRLALLSLLLLSAPAIAQQASTNPVTPPLDLTPDAHGSLSQAQMQALFRLVAEKDMENEKRLRNYTYIERQVQNSVNGKGMIKSSEVNTYEVLEVYGEQVQRLIEKNDKPLSPKDAAKEEQKIQKIIDKRKNKSEGARRKREEHEAKDREDSRKFVTEVADAYNFKLIGAEPVGGREAWVIDGEPRPGYVPHIKEGKFLAKFQGSRLMLEQTRVNDEVWLPAQVTAKIDVRLGLIKNFDVDLEQSFRDYKKFGSSTKVVAGEEVKE